MAEFLKAYTKEQLINFIIAPIVNKAGITAMNSGDAFYELIDSLADILETIQADTVKEAKQLIEIALFTGMDFNRKPAQPAAGQIRAYRIPAMTLTYSGASAFARVTNNGATFSINTSDAGDNFTVNVSSYPTIQDLCVYIGSLPSYTCQAVKGSEDTADLFYYTDKDIVGKIDYLNQSGCDLTLNTDGEVQIIAPFIFTANDHSCRTESDYILLAGESSVSGIASESQETGNIQIGALALDTFNGKGVVSGAFPGIFWINDNTFTPGTEEETNEERKDRWRVQIFGASKHNRFGIESAILNLDQVRSVTLLESTPKRGYNTVVVDDGTGTISDTLRAEVQKVFDGDPNDPEKYPGVIIPGMTGFIQAPDIIGVDVNMTIYKTDASIDDTEIISSVQSAVIQYINRLRLGYDVVDSALTTTATNAHPSVFRAVLNSGATSIGETEIARTNGTFGTVTITVVQTAP
jgi:hypothetical protein